MSNLIYTCRPHGLAGFSGETLARVADRITPALLRGEFPHHLHLGPGEGLCVTGPHGAVQTEGASACLGALVGDGEAWARPGSPLPDGTYALVRADGHLTELCSDYAGTRTLWYAFTEREFLASTSQRALICLLRGLSFNRSAFAWFLSSGSLGPSDSWDTRIRRLPRGARLTLDRGAWTLDLHTSPVVFQNLSMSRAEALENLGSLVGGAIRNCHTRSPRWVVPLSGGYDSRMVLAALEGSGFRPRTVTWGLASTRLQRGNDAFVAEKLARHYGLVNDYFLTERSGAPPAEVVDAFMAAHGGTTEALFPYLDGLRMWAGLAREGVGGIIRGDEGFGTISRPETHHRYAQDMVLLSEILGEETAGLISDGRQILPDDLKRRPEESLQTYGDRLIHTCFIPISLAALSDVKTPFVEVANPMLARTVMEFVRQLPDHLRVRRNLYEQLVRSLSPPIPFATLAADDSRNRYLHDEDYRSWMAGELEGPAMTRLLPPPFRASLVAALRSDAGPLRSSAHARAILKRIVPAPLISAIRTLGRPAGPTLRVMAFRCALASRLLGILEQDARTLEPAEAGTPAG
ncbi:asparagine synthetase B family protein [Mesoterricola silvestris]|uniref:Asparagine synthetase domain-containing protein n=1 Tax=Mesoterricola silvestris TaxID=2927979 RepID=A0AA48GI89_9BACT|nr:hypothetical protein [Mesoterricola silvestris]BDU71757.1 hypothetical protein METEAL_09310 [Mesoterricola silvestris]